MTSLPFKTVTNNVPRFLLDASDLTTAERAEFDYLDWDALDAGTESATFFRYKGWTYSLSDFTVPAPAPWDGMHADSYFSATVVRVIDQDSIIVGRIYS